MGDVISEFAALMEEFGTTVLQLNAVIGIAVMIVIFVLEVRWTRSHPPHSRRMERASALGHVVTARRIKYWDDGITPDEKTTSWYHATYAYEVSGKQYRYKYLERAVPPIQIKLYYLDNPGRAFRGKEKRSALSQIFLLLFPIAAGVAVMLLLGVR
ncbi:MAG TPA: hypothetical protein H9671_02390 [Firmicutes bacterium]|nr:hypothetical protein [Bacillota bacterium]